MSNRIVLNKVSYHGRGAVAELVGEVKAGGYKKALLCVDPDLVKLGVAKRVTDVLDGASLPYELFSGLKANPTIENVQV